MLNINIICVGKLKEKYLKDALNEYIKRLSRYCKLTITELPDEKIPDKLNPNLEIDIKTKESNNIINHIKKDSYIIALDLTGKQFGDFIVVDRAPNKVTPSGQQTRVWHCKCKKCGLERNIQASQLKKNFGKMFVQRF